MGFKKILIGAASVMALTTGLATAGYERDGWYLGLEGGWGRVSETDISNEALEFADGMAILGTAGYAFKNSNWRIEGEVGYRNNDVDKLDKASFSDGELEEWSGMVNAIYDFNLNSERWGLGLGAGIGIDNARYTSPIDGNDSNDKTFAFQGIAGLTYRVNQHWDIMLNYRYFNVAQAEGEAIEKFHAQPVLKTFDVDRTEFDGSALERLRWRYSVTRRIHAYAECDPHRRC